jgi:hypothetical protein
MEWINIPLPYLPYPIYGYILPAYLINVVVIAVNQTTLESISILSETDGSYLIDCANFTSGYTNGDIIELSVYHYKTQATINMILSPAGVQANITITPVGVMWITA